MAKKLLYSVCLIFSSILLFAQNGRLTLHGKVEHNTKLLSYVGIEVYQDNELLEKKVTLKNGSYKLEMPLGSVYNIAFSKKGFINKSIAVIAKTDSTVNVNGRYFFQLDIEMFEEDEAEEDESLIPPVAKLYIKDEESGFQYDKKYVRWAAGNYED